MNTLWIICWWPSAERWISLNSARSLIDQLWWEGIDIIAFYVNPEKQWYQIEEKELYSNTPSDFDFRLARWDTVLSDTAIIRELKKCDIVFPAIHGSYWEDGELQSFLEKNNIPYIGTRSRVCKELFDKYRFNEALWWLGFTTIPTEVLKIYHEDHETIIRDFFGKYRLSRAIIKPASSWSSIGVFSVESPEEAIEKVRLLFSKRIDTRVVIQPFMSGTEFTVIILQNQFNLPVAILPTEISLSYEEWQLFDYRKKYLPTRAVSYHCPPRFSDETLELIRIQSEQIFSWLGMQDIVRLDGWILEDGKIWFADFNPVSGMEQNSFLFQQWSRVGFSHSSLLWYIIINSAKRQWIKIQLPKYGTDISRKKIAVLMWGDTAEKQVSLMSWTNVWLKLRKSDRYIPDPYIIYSLDEIWSVPYPVLLNHTVEEIHEVCRTSVIDDERIQRLIQNTRIRLSIPEDIPLEAYHSPKKIALEKIMKDYDTVFLALHGWMGEDGTLQTILEEHRINFNGSSASTSRLCMDKYETGLAITKLDIDWVSIAEKISLYLDDVLSRPTHTLWDEIRKTIWQSQIIVKPQSDGCSAWVVLLRSVDDLWAYLNALRLWVSSISPGTFPWQDSPIEMPTQRPEKILFETFIETDTIHGVRWILKITNKTWWIEVTVWVLEKDGKIESLEPSMTIANGTVLSVEEKFQWGTGINITPLPAEVIERKYVNRVKRNITSVARWIGIQWYARIDAFIHRDSGEIIIIEVNTLPALTPSTVLFHQWLADSPSLHPLDLLTHIIPK